MKKLFLVLVALFLLTGVCFAGQGFNPSVVTSSGQVKASGGTVYYAYITFKGATVGDTAKVVDSLTSSGTAYIYVTARTANDFIVVPIPPLGIQYGTGIYDVITISGGSAQVTLLYY